MKKSKMPLTLAGKNKEHTYETFENFFQRLYTYFYKKNNKMRL